MVLSKHGSRTFLAYDAWHQHCAKEKIKDPWEWEQEIESEYKHYKEENIDGSIVYTIECELPTEDQKQRLLECHKYRDQYMIDRELWVGKYILKNFGYNELTIFAQAQCKEGSAFQEWFAHIRPCDGADEQCSFDCAHFSECRQ